jgi:hypothetical protein
MKWLTRTVIFIAVGAFAFAVFSPFCNLLFRCGCEGFWAAGSKFCNVHKAGIPHCPLCSTGNWGAFLPKAFILISQAMVVFLPQKLSAIWRLALGIVAFLIIGTAIGLIFRLWTHYPTFLGY